VTPCRVRFRSDVQISDPVQGAPTTSSRTGRLVRRLPLRSPSGSSLACFDGTSHLHCLSVDPRSSRYRSIPALRRTSPTVPRRFGAPRFRPTQWKRQFLNFFICPGAPASGPLAGSVAAAVASRRPGKLTTPSAPRLRSRKPCSASALRFGLAVLQHTPTPPASARYSPSGRAAPDRSCGPCPGRASGQAWIRVWMPLRSLHQGAHARH